LFSKERLTRANPPFIPALFLVFFAICYFHLKLWQTSYLPKCHLDNNLDWQDSDHPRTSFEQATALEPIQEEQGHNAGFATKGWCTLRMRIHYHLIPGRRNQPHHL
jgi:hypothetical protein